MEQLQEENERLRASLAAAEAREAEIIKAVDDLEAGYGLLVNIYHQAEAERDRLRAALEAVEWGTQGICPSCEQYTEDGHSSVCQLFAALSGQRQAGGADSCED